MRPNADMHMHAVLDGVYYRDAIDRHRSFPREDLIREMLEGYRQQGITLLRDGGDRFGACEKAKALAPEYGIEYLMPAFPIHRKGNYGGFIGRSYTCINEYRELVREAKDRGADFIKLMITGLLDFGRVGELTDYALPLSEVSELVKIAQGEGFAVMAHCNGDEASYNAAKAGIDSIEHGYYTGRRAREAMGERGTIWVPTLAPLSCPVGTGRFDDGVLQRIVDTQLEAVSDFAALGGKIAPGSDAGAFAVPHRSGWKSEAEALELALGDAAGEILSAGQEDIRRRFRRC